jgi:ATP phosphoribosyltransferase
MKLYDCLMKLLKSQTPRYRWNNHLQINQVINQLSAAVNRKKKSYTSYTVKQEKQEQKQRLNPTFMYILSDI